MTQKMTPPQNLAAVSIFYKVILFYKVIFFIRAIFIQGSLFYVVTMGLPFRCGLEDEAEVFLHL